MISEAFIHMCGQAQVREAIVRKIDHFIILETPPVPLLWSPYLFFSRPFFERKKEMILKVVWRVLMGVLRVFEGCCRVFEVCLKGVWKNKIEVWNQLDPPPFTKWFHKKSFFSQLMASLSMIYAWCKIGIKKNILWSMIHSWWLAVGCGWPKRGSPSKCLLRLSSHTFSHRPGPWTC